MERKKVLLMYSGGLDSILSMARLISQGYKVLLVHFDNGCSISTGIEVERALKFENRYCTKYNCKGKSNWCYIYRHRDYFKGT